MIHMEKTSAQVSTPQEYKGLRKGWEGMDRWSKGGRHWILQSSTSGEQPQGDTWKGHKNNPI